MPGARDLKHHRGQPVSHEVVNVAGDSAPLGKQRLLRKLAPRSVELRQQLSLAGNDEPQQPRKHHAEDPDAEGDICNEAHCDGCRHREEAQHDCCCKRRRLAGDQESEQRHLKPQRLQLPRALRRNNRNDDGEGEGHERDARQICPQGEGRHRHHRQKELGHRRGWVEHRSNYGDQERENWDDAAQVVGLGRRLR
jgi:hypothetical protein